MNFQFECPEHGEIERKMTPSEVKELPRDEENRQVVQCCDKTAHRLFTTSEIIYNAGGFYGNVPTREATAGLGI